MSVLTSAPWRVSHIALRLELDHERVLVTAESTAERSVRGDGPLRLDGRGLDLLEVAVDDRVLTVDEYQLDGESLVVHLPGSAHTVRTVATARPVPPGGKGLCSDGSVLHSNCEPEGFRRITFAIDRPAERPTFEVTLVGDPEVFPVMLSNGAIVDDGLTDDGRRWVRFLDPVAKPSYLFSCVAGDFATVSRAHVSLTGRTVDLVVAAPPEMIDGAGFALTKMAEVLAYDESIGGIEHDLDQLTFVAVPGYPDATEYHGLMFFDPALLVADARGHTDDDLMLIALNCAHEYGHHVRGNRFTVRSWDQLALKEGLTVLMGQNGFRERWLGPAARILDVLDLRRLQFPEEVTIGAPVVRDGDVDPASLYTRTTYLKGAEIFGMFRTVLGDDVWAACFAEFVRRHDLGAAGVDDFVAAVRETAPEHAAAIDAVARWFRLVGRPAVAVSTSADDDATTLHLRRTDTLSDDPAVAVPIALGFMDASGRPLGVRIDGAEPVTTHVALLADRETTLRLQADTSIVVSPLRRYSAPVDLVDDSPADQLAVRIRHESDPFSRFWATEALMIRAIDAHRRGDAAAADEVLDVLADALDDVVHSETDPLLLAQLLALPDEFMLGDREPVIDVDGVAAGLDAVRRGLGRRLHDPLCSVLDRHRSVAGGTSASDIAARWLVDPVLGLLLATDGDDALSLALREVEADDPTRAVRALAQLAHVDRVDIEPLLAATHRRWSGAPKLVDRWIRAQSGARRGDTIDRVRRLVAGDLYDRTDRGRVMAVWFPFATRNRSVFHDRSGAGYAAFVDEVIALMPTRADLVVRLVGDLLQFRRFDDERRALLRAQLERMADAPGMPDFGVAIVRGLLAAD